MQKNKSGENSSIVIGTVIMWIILGTVVIFAGICYVWVIPVHIEDYIISGIIILFGVVLIALSKKAGKLAWLLRKRK